MKFVHIVAIFFIICISCTGKKIDRVQKLSLNTQIEKFEEDLSANTFEYNKIVYESNIYEMDNNIRGYYGTNKKVKVNLDIPKNWSLEGSVFNDSENSKIGEFLPGVFTTTDDLFIKLGNSGETISGELSSFLVISKDKIKIGKNQAIRYITETTAYGDDGPIVWQPNQYYLIAENKYIGICFYNSKKKMLNKNNIEHIISSIELKLE